MCGRYTLAEIAEMQAKFHVKFDGLKPNYNVAPTQQAPVITKDEAKMMRWGLQPSWAKFKLINAKAETLNEKPMFKNLSRCVVPADGFYEWKTTKEGKQPYRIIMKDGSVFCFAGLYDGETFTIITTSPNAVMKDIHDRMPVILKPEQAKAWLEGNLELKPIAASAIKAYKVSSDVNSPKNNRKELLAEI